MKGKVILGMSGGVDSSVAAYLLKEEGYDVSGIFMKNWDESDETGACTALDDSIDASLVADQLDIPFYTINFEKEYWDKVFTYFLEEYKKGRTPNPDVMCNTEIKFNAFLKFAMEIEGDYIAMGHYARVKEKDGRYYLLKGKDQAKDQSYFLSRISEKALSRTIFPLGDLDKDQVREIALKLDMATAKKKDSTGICFIGERDFDKFLNKYLKSEPGDIYSVEGEKLGRHYGLIHYTLGQRRGIGIGGVGDGQPFFVADKDLENNILYVAQGEDHPALYSTSLLTEDFHWINGRPAEEEFEAFAKFRYRQKDLPVKVSLTEGDSIRIDYPACKGVTPGQVAVIYQGDICMGGGVIKETNKKTI